MAQQEYEQSQAIDAPPEEVFAWLSDVGSLPKYLPPVVDSSVEGPSAEGVPGRRIRTSLEYPGEGGGTFDAVGYLAVDERERRMEWGAEEGRDYSGWLTVRNHGGGGSEVVVHLSFRERSAGPEIEERAPEGRLVLGVDPLLAVHDRVGHSGARGFAQRLAEELLASRPTRAQHVQAHPPDDRGKPPAQVLDAARAGAVEAEPGLLHRVVRLAWRSEHPVGYRPQAGAMFLETARKPVAFVHLSHSSVASGHHSKDQWNPADVTRRSA